MTSGLRSVSSISILQTLAAGSSHATFVKDLSGKYIYCNPACAEFFCRDSAEVCNLSDGDLFPAEHAERFAIQDRQIVLTGCSETFDHSVIDDRGIRRYQVTKSVCQDEHGVVTGIIGVAREVATTLNAEETIRRIASFNLTTGKDYFRELVRYLSEICRVRIAFIGELDTQLSHQINTISILSGGDIADNFSYDLRNTPCEIVLNTSICFYAEGVQQAFPKDILLSEMGVESYMGIPLFGSSGQLLGIIAMLHNESFAFPEQAQTILQIVAARAGAELQRIQTEERLRVSEERHRNMLDRLPLGVLLYCEPRFLYANPMACSILGIGGISDLESTSPLDLVVEEDQERIHKLLQDFGETSEPLPVHETRICRRDQVVLDIEFTVLRTHYGKQFCHQVQFYDATARRRTEEALRETQELFSLFMQHISGLAWIKNPQGEYLYANPAALSVFQRCPEQLYGRADDQVFPRETAEQFVANDRQVLSTGRFLLTKETFRHGDGVLHYSLVNKFPIKGSNGEIKLIGGMATDITELVQAENTIRTLNEFHEAIIRTAAEGICVCYEIPEFPYVRFTVWNHRMTELTGYSVGEINDHGWYQSLYPDPELQARAIQRMQEMRKREDLQAEEWEITRKDGQRRILSISTSQVEIGGGVQGTVGMMQDVTARRLAEADLHHTTSLLQAVINGTTDSVFVKDLSGRYLLINESAAAIVGKSPAELIGQDDTWLFEVKSAEGMMERDRDIMRLGKVVTFEETATIDGAKRCFHSTKGPYRNSAGDVIGLIGISRDITRQKLIEDQFHQAQKMEAIGQLAGGIAHDFNNLLTVINGYTEIILSELPPEDQQIEPLTFISEAGQRAAALTAQLLAFSRKTIVEPKLLDLKKVIEHLGRMLRRLIGEDILLTLEISDALSGVVADLGQTEQMLLNLSVNARDAMPHGGGLTINAHDVVLSANEARKYDLAEGRYVRVQVADTGTGIAPEIQSRIFEPFFTTKDAGSGTGLGLATVYGIARQSGGNICFESTMGKGTTFTILLPAVLKSESSDEVSGNEFAPTGTETICFVEDEESVRRLIRLILETQGYTVIAGESGPDALAKVALHDGRIDMLLTDVVMPGMNGRELAQRFRRQWPSVRILYMSGYTGDAVVRYGIETAADAFLQKPFTPLVLARKIRQTLDHR